MAAVRKLVFDRVEADIDNCFKIYLSYFQFDTYDDDKDVVYPHEAYIISPDIDRKTLEGFKEWIKSKRCDMVWVDMMGV